MRGDGIAIDRPEVRTNHCEQDATWEPPAFEEIKMDAEIGAYQVDESGRTAAGDR